MGFSDTYSDYWPISNVFFSLLSIICLKTPGNFLWTVLVMLSRFISEPLFVSSSNQCVCVVKKIVLHSCEWEFVKSNATQCQKLKIDNMWQQLMHGGTYLWQFPCFAPISVTFCRWTTPITYSSQLKTFLQHAAKRERLSKPFYLDKSTPTLLSQQMHNTICNYQITANIFNKLQCKLITTCANCTLGVQCSLHYV